MYRILISVKECTLREEDRLYDQQREMNLEGRKWWYEMMSDEVSLCDERIEQTTEFPESSDDRKAVQWWFQLNKSLRRTLSSISNSHPENINSFIHLLKIIQREQKIKIGPIQNFWRTIQIRQKQNKTKDLDCVWHSWAIPMRMNSLSHFLINGLLPDDFDSYQCDLVSWSVNCSQSWSWFTC
jgi:hypothetical protein